MVFLVRVFLTATLLLVAGCQSITMSDQTSFGDNLTKDAVSARAMLITTGMSRDEVAKVFGRGPSARSFRGDAEALVYCGRSDWDGSAVYQTIWMHKGVVQALTSYSKADSSNNCGQSAREIDWGQLPPDLRVALELD